MPGRLFLTTDIATLAGSIGADPGRVDHDPPRRNIAPGQRILTVTPDRTLRHMRWGLIPVGRVNARGRPVMDTIVNARSETLFGKTAFQGVQRCIVPVDGWYEWTGRTRRKTAWRISRADAAPILFAAIYDVWTGPGGVEVPQVATITCAPSADVRDIHDRMGVILTPETADIWLTSDQAAAVPLLHPAPDGTLIVTRADDVDWHAP